jgi:hypothetical protein
MSGPVVAFARMLRRFVWLSLVGLLFVVASTPRAARADFVPPWLTGESRPEDLTISLATFGPGDEVHQYFGHIALEVKDSRLGIEALYNFGVFGFDKAFLVKFLKGHLEFWLGVQPTRLSYEFYADQDRDVRILELDLPPEKAAAMAKALAVHALPENRVYLYHHYKDNCATRIVDAIDGATDGDFKKSLQAPARLTYRGHTRRYAARDPIIDWLLVFAMNDSMEEPLVRMNELFLPVELEDAVEGFKWHGKSIVRKKRVLHEASKVRPVYDVPPVTWPYTLGLGLAGGGVFWFLGRRVRQGARWARVVSGLLQLVYGLLFGTLGLLVTVLALFTEHKVTTYDENLFFAHVGLLGLVVAGVGVARGSAWAERLSFFVWGASAGLAVLGVLLKVLPMFDQENALVYTLLLPIQLGGFAGLVMMRGGKPAGVREAESLRPSGRPSSSSKAPVR